MLFASILVAMAGVGLTACGDDDEPTNTVSEKDPQGTIVVNMLSGSSRNATLVNICGTNDYYDEIYVDEGMNFHAYSRAEIVSVGKVNGLSKVTTIPSSGWSEKVAVVPGNGYVARVGYDQFYNEVTNRWEYRSYHYGRIYVVDYLTTGGSSTGGSSTGVATYTTYTGATVKYQPSFTPTN